MRISTIRRLVAGTGWAAAAAMVALLPGLGPMLDHHYAGRQPGHGHVHVGALLPDHVHGHDLSHDHDHSNASHVAEDEGDRGGFLVIATYSGAVLGHAYVSGSASQTALSFPDPDESPHSYYSGQDGALRQQSFVTPPTEPPRA